MSLTPAILAEIEKRFAEPDRGNVRALLAACQSETVALSILQLSRGKLDKIPGLLEAARRDYRDVIQWAQQPTRRYIVGLLRKGPAWTPEDENGRTHLTYDILKSWVTARHVIVGGWFMDFTDPRAMYIFAVESVAEAEALAAQDPVIQSGKMTFEFHPWLAPDGIRIADPKDL